MSRRLRGREPRACGSWLAKKGGRLEMSSAQERQAGTTGSTVGYEPTPAQGAGYQPAGRHESGDHRAAVIGFTALAGTFMVLSGLWSAIVGTVALAHGRVFVAVPNYTFRYNIHSWGWVELVLGIVVLAAGVCVFLGMAWARYLGAALAVISAVANFMFIPYQPVWSIIMIALDAFVIWALLSPRRGNEVM